MFRISFIVILVFSLFGNAFMKTVVLADFKLNQKVIAETLCIQKAEKENTCNGKCHLTKQLEKTESDTDDSPVRVENLQEILLFYSSDNDGPSYLFEESSANNPTVESLVGINLPHSIFHPPQSV